MSLVEITTSERVATLTLNNPAERNTLTAPMVAEIIAAMDAIEADDGIGAVVVTGAAPAFCAGANLGNLAESSESSLGSIYEGFLRIARSPLPTLAAVNGAAVPFSRLRSAAPSQQSTSKLAMRRGSESAGMSPRARARSMQRARRSVMTVKQASILRRNTSLTPDSSWPSAPSRQPWYPCVR